MKKNLRKILASVAALIMVLSCLPFTSFAAEEPERSFELYQIFTGDYSEGKLSNIKWGQNGTGTTGEAVDADTLKALDDISSTASDSEKLAVITKYADLTETAYRTSGNLLTKSDGKYTYTGVTPGYYLIKDKNNSLPESETYTLYVVQSTGGKIEFEPKGSTPDVDKKVKKDGEDLNSNNSASIGDTLSYSITGTVSDQIGNFAKYYYKITDTMSAGLTLNQNSIKVYLYNPASEGVAASKVDVTNEFSTPTINIADVTTITIESTDLKTTLKNYTLNANSQIIVEYTATINEKAVIGGGTGNDVELTFSNDPNWDGKGTEDQPNGPTGETVKSTANTYTTSLTVTKVDGDDAILLGDTEFTLTGSGVNQVLIASTAFNVDNDSGTYWKLKDGTYTTTDPTEVADTSAYESTTTKYTKTVTTELKGENQTSVDVVGTISADGTVTFEGLGAGKYTLTETKTLDGYNTADPITFTISFDPSTKKFSVNNDAITVSTDGTSLSTKVVNKAGTTLPHTGGIGTAVFYGTGSALVIAAVVLLIVKKRMSREDV